MAVEFPSQLINYTELLVCNLYDMISKDTWLNKTTTKNKGITESWKVFEYTCMLQVNGKSI